MSQEEADGAADTSTSVAMAEISQVSFGHVLVKKRDFF